MKEMVFCGNGYADIVIASVLELLMRNKKVVVCDLAATSTVVTELEDISGAFGIVCRNNLVVAKGYTEEECDYKFICMVMDKVWSFYNCEHFVIVNYCWATISSVINLFLSLNIEPTFIILGPSDKEIVNVVRDIQLKCKEILALPYSTRDMDIMMKQRMTTSSCFPIYSNDMKKELESIIDFPDYRVSGYSQIGNNI